MKSTTREPRVPSRARITAMIEVPINAQNLVEHLRVLFPELEGSYQKVMSEWEGERSNYIIIGNVLQPHFVNEVSKGKISEFLGRCAAFVERVCKDGDTEAINVIWVRIFEWLIFRPQELKLLWPILGPETKANIRDAAHRWSEAARYQGRTKNLPEDNLPE